MNILNAINFLLHLYPFTRLSGFFLIYFKEDSFDYRVGLRSMDTRAQLTLLTLNTFKKKPTNIRTLIIQPLLLGKFYLVPNKVDIYNTIQYLYNIKHRSKKNEVKYELGHQQLIQYQIFRIDIIKIVWQTIRRIINDIFGVEGLDSHLY